jgi:hypothetical protein
MTHFSKVTVKCLDYTDTIEQIKLLRGSVKRFISGRNFDF